MSRLKSANLLVGIALFTLVALPMVYVLSMPVAFKLMSEEQDSEYGRPFYSPMNSILNDHPRLLYAYEPWLKLFGCNRAQIYGTQTLFKINYWSPTLENEPIQPVTDESFEFTDEELKEWEELISKRE